MSVLANAGVMGGLPDVGDIQKSLRFRSSGSTYMSRTFGTPTNNTTWTFSCWLKRGSISSAVAQDIFSSSTSAIFINTVDAVVIYKTGIGTVATSTALLRDPSAHYHLMCISDGTTVKCYVNSAEVCSYTGTITPLNSAIAHTIGKYANASTEYLDGYLSRVCFVDGSALTPSSFGYLNTEINEWVSKSQAQVKAVVDAGGANSFMLDFDNGSSLTTLGHDKSSKANNWTLNNHSLTAGSTYDWMDDRPGNSYCTLNPLMYRYSLGATTLSEANLKATNPSGTGAAYVWASMLMSSGKWYAEFVWATAGGGTFYIGVDSGLAQTTTFTDCVIYASSGQKQVAGTNSAYGASYAVNDIIGVALDKDSNTVEFFKNNVSQGVISLPTNVPMTFHVQQTTSGANYANFGQRPFTYTPPTGFKALCQQNLTSETVTVSGSFTGNLNADGPFVWLNGVPKTLTINGNAVTFGTHADKTAGGFKVRTASSSYNNTGSNTYTATIDGNRQNCFKYRNAQGNP